MSSSGGEGLDLKGTREVHILEPNWHDPKIEQVIGRAVRYKSHAHLPESDRNVKILRYHSIMPKTKSLLDRMFNRPEEYEETVDQYLKDMSDRKKELNEEFLKILREDGN